MRSPQTIVTALLLSVSCVSAIWPIPVTISTGNSSLWLAQDVKFKYEGPKDSDVLTTSDICERAQAGSKFSTSIGAFVEKRINKAIERTKEDLFEYNFVPWKFHPRRTQYEPVDGGKEGSIKTVTLKLNKLDPSTKPKVGEVDESYELQIDENGAATISANSSIGILHGLESFKQLFYKHSTSKDVYTPYAPVKITDKPLIPHRGLNLDVARQWYPVEDVKRTINALAMNKMNRLHFHVTDSQSWPLEIPSMPDLATKGRYFAGATYSPADLQGILDYASDRGVQVIVEIDMPGHTTSIAEAYPELIIAKNRQPDWPLFAAQPPSGTLKLGDDPKVNEFNTNLLNDLLPRLKEHTSYYHSGGDEVNAHAYKDDPVIQSEDPQKIQPYISRFVNHIHDVVRENGMSPVVWEEMVLVWNITVKTDTLVQAWIDAESIKRITEKGYKVIAGSYKHWYLDCGKGQWLDFKMKDFDQFYPFNDYCAPVHNWRAMYSFDPLAGLTDEEKKLVIGGEAHMWSEQTDPASLDSTVWPRASAVGEVLWSGRLDAAGNNRTFEDASQRLGEFRERMLARGIQATAITQTWCHMHKGDCTFWQAGN
ncbi:hypothetical protein BJ508DRAFT_78474 [Ascobolus immersus RN42]|uniref:Beta-hexosaminidase n=1 Tax=Ascobolus immersus RN42 TaxID=1160509 RepID=A0A3N4IEF1_ASCIM|nr:hypothetical protein BJ508DRAFT_78474 [Ascobolus immersus RN42]